MNTISPVPGSGPVALAGPPPLPAIPPPGTTARETGRQRVNDIVEAIVFYGLVAFGLSIPVIGALYAYIFG